MQAHPGHCNTGKSFVAHICTLHSSPIQALLHSRLQRIRQNLQRCRSSSPWPCHPCHCNNRTCLWAHKRTPHSHDTGPSCVRWHSPQTETLHKPRRPKVGWSTSGAWSFLELECQRILQFIEPRSATWTGVKSSQKQYILCRTQLTYALPVTCQRQGPARAIAPIHQDLASRACTGLGPST